MNSRRITIEGSALTAILNNNTATHHQIRNNSFNFIRLIISRLSSFGHWVIVPSLPIEWIYRHREQPISPIYWSSMNILRNTCTYLKMNLVINREYSPITKQSSKYHRHNSQQCHHHHGISRQCSSPLQYNASTYLHSSSVVNVNAQNSRTTAKAMAEQWNGRINSTNKKFQASTTFHHLFQQYLVRQTTMNHRMNSHQYRYTATITPSVVVISRQYWSATPLLHYGHFSYASFISSECSTGITQVSVPAFSALQYISFTTQPIHI